LHKYEEREFVSGGTPEAQKTVVRVAAMYLEGVVQANPAIINPVIRWDVYLGRIRK
jgi:hypothetical protein